MDTVLVVATGSLLEEDATMVVWRSRFTSLAIAGTLGR